MTDLEAKRKEAGNLDEGNARSYNELREKLGPDFVMDANPKRLKLLIDHLVSSGLWPVEQYLDFEIHFHTEVENSLNEVWEKVREREKEQAKPHIVTPQRPTGLVDKMGRKLI